MTQYTLHKDQKKVHDFDHGYTPMHSPENFFWYMKQGMQTLCVAVGVGIGALCVVCVLLLFNRCRSCHTPPFCTRSGANSPVAGCLFTQRHFYLHTAYKPPQNKTILAKTLCTRVRFSCTVIHVALLFTGLKSVHYSTFLDFKCFSQMNLFKLNKVSFRNQCYCYNRLVL